MSAREDRFTGISDLSLIFQRLLTVASFHVSIFFAAFAAWTWWNSKGSSGQNSRWWLELLAAIGMAVLNTTHIALPLWRLTHSNQKIRSAFPREPWKWKKEWRESRISSALQEDVSDFGSMGLGALLLGVIFWYIPVILTPIDPEHARGFFWPLLSIGSGILAMGLFVFALIERRRERRFSKTIFFLNTLPVQPGQHLIGHIQVPSGLPLTSVRLTLTSEEFIDGGTTSTSKILYQSSWAAAAEVDGEEASIPVEHPVPSDTEPINGKNTSYFHRIVWTLQAHQALSGPDFHASFAIPVFKIEP